MSPPLASKLMLLCVNARIQSKLLRTMHKAWLIRFRLCQSFKSNAQIPKSNRLSPYHQVSQLRINSRPQLLGLSKKNKM